MDVWGTHTMRVIYLAATIALFLTSTEALAKKYHHTSNPFDNDIAYGNAHIEFPGVAGGIAGGYEFSLVSQKVFKLHLGPMLGVSFAADAAYIDFAARVHPEFEIPVNEGFLALGFSVPVAFTVAPVYAGGAELGFYVGVLPGVQYFVDRHWQIFGELGLGIRGDGAPGGVFATGVGGVFNFGFGYSM
jgi:acetyltransferase-like isoleucine patch superfamily enzyme